MSNIINIKNVRAFVDDNGMAQINLEDAARGLGIVDGNSVRWARIRNYLEEFGYFATSGDGKIPHQRIGRHYRFSKEVLMKHIQCPAEPTHYVRLDKSPSKAQRKAIDNPFYVPGCLA